MNARTHRSLLSDHRAGTRDARPQALAPATEDCPRLWDAVLRCMSEGVIVCDPEGRIVVVNQAFERITGYLAAEVTGVTPGFLDSGRQGRDFHAGMWRLLRETGHWSGEVWNRRKNGEVFQEWLTIIAVRQPHGQVTHYIGVFSDVSDDKAQAQHLRQLAQFDPLTELPNRAQLVQRLGDSLEMAERQHQRVAVCFLDLDRFKEINDSIGHDAGDALLRTMARRIRSVVRHSDTVARMGGDEFVIVLEQLSGPDAAARVAEQLLHEVLRPVTLAGQDLAVSASIGICLFPEDGSDAGELVRNADTAMHQSKQNGRNRVTFYARAMNEHSVERLRTENDLRQAVARRELSVEFQPQIDLRSGLIVAAEALARWNRPGFGRVPPAEFIPMAEQCGLVGEIGVLVLDTALRQMKAWDAMGLPAITIAVNVSTLEFHERGFVDRIAGSIAAHGVPAGRVELEITESIVLRDVEGAKRILGELRRLGVKLAVDDFGTGYSSLSYLRHFSVDKLKIDKSFIDDSCDAKVVNLIRAIIAFARALDIRTNAEGVENQQQLALLRTEGCDEIQGFIASGALSPDAFGQLLRNWDPSCLGGSRGSVPAPCATAAIRAVSQ